MSKSTDQNSSKQSAKSANQPQKSAQGKTPGMNAPGSNPGKKFTQDASTSPQRTDKSSQHGSQQEKHS